MFGKVIVLNHLYVRGKNVIQLKNSCDQIAKKSILLILYTFLFFPTLVNFINVSNTLLNIKYYTQILTCFL